MKNTVQIIFPLLISTFTACVTLYKPNVIHSPLLKEKGELNTCASLAVSGSGLFNIQSAYAVSNHAGITVDGMYHNRRFQGADGSIEKLNIFFGEAGAGYFSTFGNNKSGLLQCYGGGGYGSTTDKMNKANQYTPEVDATYFNVFMQPGIAFINKNIEVAFDLRANYVRLFNIHANLYNQFEWWNTDFHYHSDTTLCFVNLEPTITFKAGGKRLKSILQFGATVPVINFHSYFLANTASMLGLPLIKISTGISYSFGKN